MASIPLSGSTTDSDLTPLSSSADSNSPKTINETPRKKEISLLDLNQDILQRVAFHLDFESAKALAVVHTKIRDAAESRIWDNLHLLGPTTRSGSSRVSVNDYLDLLLAIFASYPRRVACVRRVYVDWHGLNWSMHFPPEDDEDEEEEEESNQVEDGTFTIPVAFLPIFEALGGRFWARLNSFFAALPTFSACRELVVNHHKHRGLAFVLAKLITLAPKAISLKVDSTQYVECSTGTDPPALDVGNSLQSVYFTARCPSIIADIRRILQETTACVDVTVHIVGDATLRQAAVDLAADNPRISRLCVSHRDPENMRRSGNTTWGRHYLMEMIDRHVEKPCLMDRLDFIPKMNGLTRLDVTTSSQFIPITPELSPFHCLTTRPIDPAILAQVRGCPALLYITQTNPNIAGDSQEMLIATYKNQGDTLTHLRIAFDASPPGVAGRTCHTRQPRSFRSFQFDYVDYRGKTPPIEILSLVYSMANKNLRNVMPMRGLTLPDTSWNVLKHWYEEKERREGACVGYSHAAVKANDRQVGPFILNEPTA